MQSNFNQLAITGPALDSKPESVKLAEQHDDAIRQKAVEFEAVFIGQMLTFSGLDKALMVGGGEDASAFVGFYIDQFAEKIAQKGGFGLADKIYTQMTRISEAQKGDARVNADKL